MPSPKNEPELYMPNMGILAMKVLRPYQAVADWCGGILRKDGVKFSHIDLVHEGQVHRLVENDWVVAERNEEDASIISFVPIKGDRARHFEKRYRKAIPHECF